MTSRKNLIFCCNTKKLMLSSLYQNAVKETLVTESDRNTVSPTESTVCGK